MTGLANATLPTGFVRFVDAGREVVCAAHVERAVRLALGDATLIRWAERQPDARALSGRGVAYAVALPADAERVVVRHNRHGGLFAPLTGDLFAPPTRAPYELATSERLRAASVNTPAMLGYVLYAAGPLRRVDVFTREVPDAADLADALMDVDAAHRGAALESAAHLVRTLSGAGARHHDLNIKNILLQRRESGLQSFALDVDRVEFDVAAGTALELNLSRLLRSARKWQHERGARVTDSELERFATLVRDQRSRSAST